MSQAYSSHQPANTRPFRQGGGPFTNDPTLLFASAFSSELQYCIKLLGRSPSRRVGSCRRHTGVMSGSRWSPESATRRCSST